MMQFMMVDTQIMYKLEVYMKFFFACYKDDGIEMR